MKLKSLLWMVFLLALVTGGYFYFFRTAPKTIAWRTAPVVKGDIQITVTATGSLNALTTVQVGTQVSGTIAKLYADFNTVVKKGQVIALIDTTFLSASREDAEAAYEKANVQLNQMKIEYDRIKKLYEVAAVAQADYDLALTNYQTAQSAVRSARAQLNRAKINLKYATILAPISGTVISRNVDVGQTVIASFNTPTLFTIANDLKKMQVYANIDEADIGEVKVGQEATFTVDAYPDEIFSGEIKQIRLQPNTIQNVVNYTVLIDVSNPDLKLMPGLTANINVKVKEHRNVLKVPSNALHFVPPADYLDQAPSLPDSVRLKFKNYQPANFSEGNRTWIWIRQGEEIFPHRVTIGLSDGSYTEVSDGIRENDEAVLGINKDQNSGTQAKNPFVPSFPHGTRRATR